MSNHDEQESPLEYARANGLAIDHRTWNPLLEVQQSASSTVLEEDSELPAPTPLYEYLEHEKLHVDKETLRLLEEATRIPQNELKCPDPYWRHDLKLELPLLMTDHELDMIDFLKRTTIAPNLEHDALPEESVDDEADEGIAWPSWCQNLPDTIMSKINSEKLSISKENLAYLQHAIRPPREGDIVKPIDLCSIEYKKVCESLPWYAAMLNSSDYCH
jgi:hypothetical protein